MKPLCHVTRLSSTSICTLIGSMRRILFSKRNHRVRFAGVGFYFLQLRQLAYDILTRSRKLPLSYLVDRIVSDHLTILRPTIMSSLGSWTWTRSGILDLIIVQARAFELSSFSNFWTDKLNERCNQRYRLVWGLQLAGCSLSSRINSMEQSSEFRGCCLTLVR